MGDLGGGSGRYLIATPSDLYVVFTCLVIKLCLNDGTGYIRKFVNTKDNEMKIRSLMISGTIALIGLLSLTSFSSDARTEYLTRCLPRTSQDGDSSSQEPPSSSQVVGFTLLGIKA
jgi:hypothetical protein